VFWVISVYFNIRNTLPKYDTFLLGHPVYSGRGGESEIVAGRIGKVGTVKIYIRMFIYIYIYPNTNVDITYPIYFSFYNVVYMCVYIYI